MDDARLRGPDTGSPRLTAIGFVWQPYTADLDAGYSWKNEGQMVSVTYPQAWFDDYMSALTTYTYSFDSMGRPNKLSDNYNPNPGLVPSVTYGPAGGCCRCRVGRRGSITTWGS